MPNLKCAVVGLALSALAVTTPAAADGYPEVVDRYAHGSEPELIEVPDIVVPPYAEVTIRYRGAPGHGYRGGFVRGRPDPLWRQREVAYDAIFTRGKRIIYDSNRAALTRDVIGSRRPEAHYYRPRPYYHRHGSIKDYGPPPVGFYEPVFDPAGTCGTFRYWNGDGCVDARFYSRYKNPYRWKSLHR